MLSIIYKGPCSIFNFAVACPLSSIKLSNQTFAKGYPVFSNWFKILSCQLSTNNRSTGFSLNRLLRQPTDCNNSLCFSSMSIRDHWYKFPAYKTMYADNESNFIESILAVTKPLFFKFCDNAETYKRQASWLLKLVCTFNTSATKTES